MSAAKDCCYKNWGHYFCKALLLDQDQKLLRHKTQISEKERERERWKRQKNKKNIKKCQKKFYVCS